LALDAEDQVPPLLDEHSFVNLSSSSSEDSATHNPLGILDIAPQTQSASSELHLDQPVLPLGEGLLNILQAYSAQDDSLDVSSENISSASNINNSASLDGADMEEDVFLPDNVNVASPNEAHLQLMLGKVQTHFFPIPEEHDLTRKLSSEGLCLWEKYFAPNMHESQKKSNYSVVDIPVSWINFITLMLLTPEKFDWAKSFLSSQLWHILKEPLNNETFVQFAIPDKCVTSKAPSCSSMPAIEEENSLSTLAVDNTITPKRKRRDGKAALVESEVRRSPRLVLLNEGYKNHATCANKNCITCNAAPPIMSSKVVKNLALSFCKVAEETVEKNILKKSKTTGGDNQVSGAQGTIGHRKKPSEKGQDKTVVLAHQAKKKTLK
jgi:hypothetical protein